MFLVFQRIVWPLSITEEDHVCRFLKFGDQTCPSFILFYFFGIHVKGVVLELLAPICKREKSNIYSCGFLSTGGIPPCSRWGHIQTFHLSFPFLVGLSLSLTDTSALLVPPSSITEVGWRCIRGRPNGIPDWFSVPYHQDLWFALFLWCHPGWSRVALWNVSQARTTMGSIHVLYAYTHSWVQSWSQ